jgi:hypothetical protein
METSNSSALYSAEWTCVVIFNLMPLTSEYSKVMVYKVEEESLKPKLKRLDDDGNKAIIELFRLSWLRPYT